MSEFGLEMPPVTKTGSDGKGPKAFVVKQTHMAGIMSICAVLFVMYLGTSADLRAQKTMLNADIEVHMQNGEHQRLAKLEAETHLQEVAAEMAEQVGHAEEAESDLKIMAQHINFIQKSVLMGIHKTLDDPHLTVGELKTIVNDQFVAMSEEIESIMHDHLVTIKDANKKSNEAMKHIHEVLAKEMEEQEKEEQRYREAQQKAHEAAAEADKAVEEHAQKSINQIYDHVFALAEKMGDADIDSLLSAETVQKWERLITDTEEGKLNYEDAVQNMEEVLTKNPAALKLAEVTNTFELVHEDGGKKGVTEVTNFRSLIKHVKWLPEYAAVIDKLTTWKEGHMTTQQVLTWVQEQVLAGSIDDRWLAEAMKTSGLSPAISSAQHTSKPTSSSSDRGTSKAAVGHSVPSKKEGAQKTDTETKNAGTTQTQGDVADVDGSL